MDDKNKEKENQTQNTSEERQDVNPFRDTGAGSGPELSVEEDSKLEQQRKEALTERD